MRTHARTQKHTHLYEQRTDAHTHTHTAAAMTFDLWCNAWNAMQSSNVPTTTTTTPHAHMQSGVVRVYRVRLSRVCVCVLSVCIVESPRLWPIYHHTRASAEQKPASVAAARLLLVLRVCLAWGETVSPVCVCVAPCASSAVTRNGIPEQTHATRTRIKIIIIRHTARLQ